MVESRLNALRKRIDTINRLLQEGQITPEIVKSYVYGYRDIVEVDSEAESEPDLE